MQRADRIGLIVASALVVVLAAGGGLLLLKRNQVLASERPVDTSVRLTQLEDTTTPEATAAVTPAKETKPVVPTKPKGYDFGYVTKVTGSGNSATIKWDPAELLTGKEADLYAKKMGAVLNTQLYYIANATKTTKTYDITSKTEIVVTTADGSTTKMSASAFAKEWNASGPVRKRPWFLSVSSGVVRRMVQVVLPSASAQ